MKKAKKTASPPSFKSSSQKYLSVPLKITEDEARSALIRSGYLIEYRTENLLRKRGWYVEANVAYEDTETQKSREVDIYALKHRPVGTGQQDHLFSSLLIECVNNPQPIAFITKKPYVPGWAVGMIKGVFDPEDVTLKNGQAQNIGDLLKISSYHHYCRGRYATQFCSFKQKSGEKEWMALHEDTHFNVFGSLVKALEHRLKSFSMVPGSYIRWEFMYPVLLVQGDLLDVRSIGSAVKLQRVDHVKFERTLIWKGEERGYVIDVVTESYFPQFVGMLEVELQQIASRVKRHIQLFRTALASKYTGETVIPKPPVAKFGALLSGASAPTAEQASLDEQPAPS